MPLDPYSLCPGGRNEKIRFCCPNLLKELNQIESLMTGGQFAAALALIESLEKDHPDCACLKATECQILRQTKNWDRFLETARAFVEAEPDNVRAISERVIALAIAGDSEVALSTLIDGIEKNAPGRLEESLFLPIIMTGGRLLEDGSVFPAVALAKLAQAMAPKSQEAAGLLEQIYGRRDIPLLLKEWTFDRTCPDDFPKKARYEEAVVLLATGHWKRAGVLLEELLPEAEKWPNLYRTLALARFWLLNDQGGTDALEKFASFPQVPADDAIDAETLALLMKERSSADSVDLYFLVIPVENPDSVLESLLSSRTIQNQPFDPRQYRDADLPTPSHFFEVLDRPFPDKGEKPTLETTPVRIGTVLYFGKETDRSARLEIQVLDSAREAVMKQLSELLGNNLGKAESEEPIGSLPWLSTRLERPFRFRSDAQLSHDDLTALYHDFLEREFLPEWLTRPRSDLGGISPMAAAEKDDMRRKLIAEIEIFRLRIDPLFADFLTSHLRRQLGLGPETAISIPAGADEAATLEFFKDLPIWRWDRVDLTGLSVENAGKLLSVARLFAEGKTTSKLAEKILESPAKKENAPSRVIAYESLIEKETMEGRTTEALGLIQKACAEAKDFGYSDSRFNLREVMIRLTLGQASEFQRAVEHLASNHHNEPETMESLQNLLVQVGVLNPDGSPRERPPRGNEAMGGGRGMTGGFSVGGADEPIPSEEPPKSSGLWTPGSDDARSGGAGGGKLWTPD